MKFKKIYLSVIFFLSLLGLTGCTYEKYDVKFLDSSYNRFDYKGEHYGVTNQLILYEDIESKVSNHYDIYEISYDDSNNEIKNDILQRQKSIENGSATPSYTISNVAGTMAKAGLTGCVIGM